MGYEARCEARIQGRWQEGLARLEEKEIVFRGAGRVRVPLDRVQGVRAAAGVLSFRLDGQDLALRLGSQAERWADRILRPPSRLDKLGVKPGMRVAVLGLEDRAFLAELKARGATVVGGRATGADMVFLRCASRADLRRLPALAGAIEPEGAVWALWPRGGKELREQHVREAALPTGLVDVKVAAFSETLSALKLMIRRERRPPRAATARPRAPRREGKER